MTFILRASAGVKKWLRCLRSVCSVMFCDSLLQTTHIATTLKCPLVRSTAGSGGIGLCCLGCLSGGYRALAVDRPLIPWISMADRDLQIPKSSHVSVIAKILT